MTELKTSAIRYRRADKQTDGHIDEHTGPNYRKASLSKKHQL